MLGGGGDKIIIMSAVPPHGSVSVFSLGYFSSVISSSEHSHVSLPLFILHNYIFNSITRIIVVGRKKCVNPHQDKDRSEKRRNKIILIV